MLSRRRAAKALAIKKARALRQKKIADKKRRAYILKRKAAAKAAHLARIRKNKLRKQKE